VSAVGRASAPAADRRPVRALPGRRTREQNDGPASPD